MGWLTFSPKFVSKFSHLATEAGQTDYRDPPREFQSQPERAERSQLGTVGDNASDIAIKDFSYTFSILNNISVPPEPRIRVVPKKFIALTVTDHYQMHQLKPSARQF